MKCPLYCRGMITAALGASIPGLSLGDAHLRASPLSLVVSSTASFSQWRALRIAAIRLQVVIACGTPSISCLTTECSELSQRIRETLLNHPHDDGDYFDALSEISLEINGHGGDRAKEVFIREQRHFLLREIYPLNTGPFDETRLSLIEDTLDRTFQSVALLRLIQRKKEESRFWRRESLVESCERIESEVARALSPSWSQGRRARQKLLAGAYFAFLIIEESCIQKEINVEGIRLTFCP